MSGKAYIQMHVSKSPWLHVSVCINLHIPLCSCVTERPPATPKSVTHMLPALPQNLKTEVCMTDRHREGEGRGEERTGRGQFVSVFVRGGDIKEDVSLWFKQVKHSASLL